MRNPFQPKRVHQGHWKSLRLTGVTLIYIMTHVTKTQIYLPKEDLLALHRAAKRSGRSVAELVREAIKRVWLRPTGQQGPVGLWDGLPKRTSADHDSIYDQNP